MAKRGWQKQPSAQDNARALLDSLMGPARDKKAKNDGIREGFKEANVCKRYLAGLCPNDWFKNTKREMDHCNGIHSDQLVDELQAHPEVKMYMAQYEQELLDFLEEICMDADRWIARERGNLKQPGKELQLSTGQRKALAEKQDQYRTLIDLSTRLGDEGEVRKSSAAMAEAQDIKKEIEEITAKFTVDTGGEAVCEACGVRYPLGDTPNEVGDRNSHFSGKMHEAYSAIREKVLELRKKKKNGEWDEETKRRKEKEKEKDEEKGVKDGSPSPRERRGRDRRGGASRGTDRDRNDDRGRDRRRSRSRG
eukprot:CAMPEP_0170630780 /NCGR_PEP_ID=MMETSP0224-20130122/34218_1 /TAXON_ID=285029 /ORGANISM="Togula jolla, Strain CCCM 725" /LENGTH=307 /DNA_ID=CAMNT_0010958931 /DNA_START=1 /DNA_END=921 /DNA_ORIENTATION=-